MPTQPLSLPGVFALAPLLAEPPTQRAQALASPVRLALLLAALAALPADLLASLLAALLTALLAALLAALLLALFHQHHQPLP